MPALRKRRYSSERGRPGRIPDESFHQATGIMLIRFNNDSGTGRLPWGDFQRLGLAGSNQPIDQPVLAGEPARPPALKSSLQGVRLSDALERVPLPDPRAAMALNRRWALAGFQGSELRRTNG